MIRQAVELYPESVIIVFEAISVDYDIRPKEFTIGMFGSVSAGYAQGTDWRRSPACREVPTEGIYDVAFELVRFNEIIWPKDAFTAFKTNGLRPATYEEFYSFLLHHLNRLSKSLPISAPGSFCRWGGFKGNCVPYVHKHPKYLRPILNLSIHRGNTVYTENESFLTVRDVRTAA